MSEASTAKQRVSDKVQNNGKKAHFGRVFRFTVEKNSGLPDGHLLKMVSKVLVALFVINLFLV